VLAPPIAIWQLRDRVDSFQRYNDKHFVCSGKTLAGSFVKVGIFSKKKLLSLIRMNCKKSKIHLHFYFSTVPLTVTVPSYAHQSLLAGWCFLFFRSTSSRHGLRAPVRLYFSHTSLSICTLKWRGTVFVSTLACSSHFFPQITILHMCVRVCHNEIISNMIDYCSTCFKHLVHFMHALYSMFNVT